MRSILRPSSLRCRCDTDAACLSASDALESARRRDHIVVEMWCLFWRAYVETVGIRDLKRISGRHLKRVRSGVHLLVTERGRSIANQPSGPAIIVS
jgi:hypothetical protein